MAKLTDLPAQIKAKFERMPGEDFVAVLDRENSALDALIEHSSSLPEGEIIGAVISFTVADGKAKYRVESGKPLALAHIPFGDRYQVSPIMIRGLREEDVRQMVESERKLHALFSGKKRMGMRG